MINNNILANRLNKTREGLEPNNEKPEEFNRTLSSSEELKDSINLKNKSKVYKYAYNISKYIMPVVKLGLISIIYGSALNIIIKAGWSFPQVLVIGLALELITTKIFSFFNKKS